MKIKSFTLVELLVVIVIIGILATLVILSLQSSVRKARDSRAKDSIKQTQTAISQMQLIDPNLTKSLGAGGSLVAIPTDKILGLDGSHLLNSTPLDGQNGSVQMNWDISSYVIVGKSSQGNDKCWYVSDKSDNFATGPSSCSSIILGI